MPSIGGYYKFAVETSASRGRNIPFLILGNLFGFVGSLLGGLAGLLGGGGGGGGSATPTFTIGPIRGLKELNRALGKIPGDLHEEMNRELSHLAREGAIRAAHSASIMELSPRTVSGYKAAAARPASKMQWASISQTRRRTTGKRPDFARLQEERILAPLAAQLAPEAEAAISRAIDRALKRNGF